MLSCFACTHRPTNGRYVSALLNFLVAQPCRQNMESGGESDKTAVSRSKCASLFAKLSQSGRLPFSLELGPAGAKRQLKDELLSYCVVTEPAKTMFGKARKTYTGKVHGEKRKQKITKQTENKTKETPLFHRQAGRPRDSTTTRLHWLFQVRIEETRSRPVPDPQMTIAVPLASPHIRQVLPGLSLSIVSNARLHCWRFWNASWRTSRSFDDTKFRALRAELFS